MKNQKSKMQNQRLKVAVIGVGHLGKEHARIYSQMPQVELVGVVDIDQQRAKEVASRYGTSPTVDIDKIDAASVVVPTDKHFEVAKELLERGKNVLIEKPMTRDLKEARQLLDLAKRRNLFIQVGHVERYNPIIQSLVKLVKRPRFIEIHRLSPFTPRGTEVGVVLDLMIHDIDIVLGLVKDSVKHIDAIGVNVLTPYEDIANARITFRNGCVANLTSSRVSPERMRKIRVFQENSYTSIDYYKQEGVCYYKKDGKILKEDLTVGKEEPLKLELEDFVDSVLNGRKPLVSGEDAVKVMEVADEIRKRIWK